MQKPRLSLDYYYVTRSTLIASPVEDDRATRVAPKLSYEAHIFEDKSLFVFARVTWGAEGETPYYIQAEVNGSFQVDLSELRGKVDADGVRLMFANMAVNAAQILHGGLRGHVSSITSVAPHGTWYLPTEMISAMDVELYVRDEEELISSLAKPPRKRKASKRQAASIEKTEADKTAKKKPQ
ncbi:hypothetical protein [Stenotrophomonas maltophilia]|uniref:hypothetical protein n=1 Tax=Stenotrophomonas maltophilia TaxID=40324 RepID=UPI001ED9DFB5|nr:hypothetical protein [Stenotrophomonas maltophilia]UKJ24194.1 hypothetical protein L6173_12695 [Stenotrophomonas maltophilia]